MKFAGEKIEIEHIEGKHNVLADSLSRLVNSCVIACTAKEKEPQMKKITRAAVVAVDKALAMNDALENEDNLHGTSQMKEQETSKQIFQISNHCQQVLQELSKPKNRRGNTKEYKEKPIHIQSMSTQLVPSKELQEPWKQPPSKMLSQHSQKSMKSCDTKHKFVVEKDQETTTSKMYGPISPLKPSKLEDYYRKPKNFLIYNDTQSNNSDDDDIIVDPGWDDFCLEAAKLPRMEAHRL
ncbi:hypothetical protein Tco_1033934 [Tanacetum coccineum]